MKDVQNPISPLNMNTDEQLPYYTARHSSARLLRPILLGIGSTIVLTCVELALFGLFWLHGDSTHRASTLLTLIIHNPLLGAIPLLEAVGIFFVAFTATKPLALLAYGRAAQRAHEHYRKTYTALSTMTNIYETSVVYYQESTASLVVDEGGYMVSLPALAQRQDAHLLLLGEAGAGKTTALHLYEALALQQRSSLASGHSQIPVYVPMSHYGLFLQMHERQATRASLPTLLDFLYESDLPGMHALRPYLKSLVERGRLLLLCDDVHAVDSQYLAFVCQELVQLMLSTQNRVIMTCREEAYREQQALVALVLDGHVGRGEITPLYHEQVREFVEHFLKAQDGQEHQGEYTAGQVLQAIERSRLRYSCTNPMFLSLLLESVDQVGVGRVKQLDTRSRLLRAWVTQRIEREQQQPAWSKAIPPKSDVLHLLSRIACAAFWAGERDAIQLPISRSLAHQEKHLERGETTPAVADALQTWLDEHPAQGPFTVEEGRQTGTLYEHYDREQLAGLVQFAQSATLIEVSPRGVLSFRHELLAAYFVAEYFSSSESAGTSSGTPTRGVARQSVPLPIHGELLVDVERWSEPVALWAGLVGDPMNLAERFALLGRSNPTYALQAMVFSLLCIGVLWTPPQAETQRLIVLPSSIEDILASLLLDTTTREALADLFTRCAEAGGQEVYRSLLALLMVEGIEELLLLLNTTIVPALLFVHLYETVDMLEYEAPVKRLVRILGRFGAIVVPRATELSRPAAGRSVRLRAAAINVLGGTRDQQAVEPLIARLSDTEPFIAERAVNGLIRLGPDLTLPPVLAELENRKPTPFTRQIHQATLLILSRFLDEQDSKHQLTPVQRKRIVETLLLVLSSQYTAEPEVQQKAREILLQCGEEVVELLIRSFGSKDEMLARSTVQLVQQIGSVAIPALLGQLDQNQQASEHVRMRVVEVLAVMRAAEVLPALLRLLADPSLLVQQAVANALRNYSPESIPGLIELVLTSNSEPVASRAAQILGDLGRVVVAPVLEVLLNVVPGRTRLLVHVLERTQDPQVIPALIDLLEVASSEPLLAIAVVRALSKFRDKQVVPALLRVLADSNSQLYEEAIDALSHLGEIALEGIVAALDVEHETSITLRLQRVLLGMTPFPGEALINAMTTTGTDAQAQQIMLVFQKQGSEAAQALVMHLFHTDLRVRGYIRQTLPRMDGRVVIPALLEALNRPAWLPVLTDFLLKHSEAIPQLVGLLGDRDRDDAAATILLRFGPVVLPSLVPALDDQGSIAQEHAKRIVVRLVRQSPQTLSRVVQLFALSLPPRAYQALLDVLTDNLADSSIPPLLEGLADAHLVVGVSEALVRLVQRGGPHRDEAMQGLLDALRIDERRYNAEAVLVEIGALAVSPVGHLITDSNPQVVASAKRILRDIGVAAFGFIWAAHSDKSNLARREAALEVFHSMPTTVIIDELVERLTSDKAEDISMALSLLLERIHDEVSHSHVNQDMIPALLEHVQAHGEERASLRLLSLLLLIGGPVVIDQMVRTLYDYPQHHQRLAHAFLLLGTEAKETLLAVFRDTHTPMELRAEVVGVLSIIAPLPEVTEAARTLADYGLSSNRTKILNAEKLAISLRALGGLLAAGHWDVPMLQELSSTSKQGSAEGELYDVLLGWRYGPHLQRLENDLQSEQQARNAEQKEYQRNLRRITQQMMLEQERIVALEHDLEELRREHGEHKDRLHQTTREKEELAHAQQALAQENAQLKQSRQVLAQEKQKLTQASQSLVQEKQVLAEQLTQSETRNGQLLQEVRRLRSLQG